jgi:hypothetical protein
MLLHFVRYHIASNRTSFILDVVYPTVAATNLELAYTLMSRLALITCDRHRLVGWMICAIITLSGSATAYASIELPCDPLGVKKFEAINLAAQNTSTSCHTEQSKDHDQPLEDESCPSQVIHQLRTQFAFGLTGANSFSGTSGPPSSQSVGSSSVAIWSENCPINVADCIVIWLRDHGRPITSNPLPEDLLRPPQA